MENSSTNIAEELLKIKAVQLRPGDPYRWASGWRSPVYCDNRLTLSYPALRSAITSALVELIRERYPDTTGVAGVATAGIPQGALVAEKLGLPFIYVRSEAKKHGMGNQIEGRLETERKYVVIEDLISTGGSSLLAISALKAAGGQVLGVAAMFDYGFPHAIEAFKQAEVPCHALVGLEQLLAKAVEIHYIQPRELEVVKEWRQDPVAWTAKVESQA
ncbi:MAG: orotate phosphoribosyltransferase [Bacteroidia bacterium]